MPHRTCTVWVGEFSPAPPLPEFASVLYTFAVAERAVLTDVGVKALHYQPKQTYMIFLQNINKQKHQGKTHTSQRLARAVWVCGCVRVCVCACVRVWVCGCVGVCGCVVCGMVCVGVVWYGGMVCCVLWCVGVWCVGV